MSAATPKAAYLVIYEGEPENREAFLGYYVHHHLPIIWRWPGIRRVEVHVRSEGKDPLANPSRVFMIARFTFDSMADLHAALQSPERRLAREDCANFPAFYGTIRHQAVEIVDVPRNS